MTKFRIAVLALLACCAVPVCAANAALQISITIQNHRFSPAQIDVPSGTAIELSVSNLDPTPEEFDSTALKVEQVIPGGQTAKLRLRPLAPGRFPFMGEYHADTAQGVVIAH